MDGSLSRLLNDLLKASLDLESCTRNGFYNNQMAHFFRFRNVTTLLPDGPWKRVAADICKIDKRNYFFRFIDIAYLSDMSGNSVTLRLSNIFARCG